MMVRVSLTFYFPRRKVKPSRGRPLRFPGSGRSRGEAGKPLTLINRRQIETLTKNGKIQIISLINPNVAPARSSVARYFFV